MTTIYVSVPAGPDIWDPGPHQPIADVDTGAFIGLVAEATLQIIGRQEEI